jgi:hypothetical protein
MPTQDASSFSFHLGDSATVAAGLFGGLITGISLGFLLWQII